MERITNDSDYLIETNRIKEIIEKKNWSEMDNILESKKNLVVKKIKD